MSFKSSEINYGVLKVKGRSVEVYESSSSYSLINTETEVESANWAGDAVLVKLKNGKMRRYKTKTTYENV